MMGPYNGPMAHFPFKHMQVTNLNGPFEISLGPLQNLMGTRILNIYIRAYIDMSFE